MEPSSLTRRAIAAARSLARRHGLVAASATLLHDGWNVVVGLEPEPVVIRVATLTAEARRDRIEALLHQEVALVAHLAAAGAPTVEPARELPAGPHREDGLWLVAMRRADHDPRRQPQARELGATLRQVHEALAHFQGPMAPLDPLAEVAEILDTLVLPPADLAELRGAYARLRPVFDGLVTGPCQPLHGDAHPGNVLATPAGPRWTDFEEAAHGPVGWDLACLVSRLRDEAPLELEAALDAYGREHVRDLDAWLALRALVVVAWSLSLAAERKTDPQVPLARWRARFSGSVK